MQQQPQLTSSRCIGHGLWQIYSKLRFLFSSPILIAFSSSYSFHILCAIVSCTYVTLRWGASCQLLECPNMKRELYAVFLCSFYLFCFLNSLFTRKLLHYESWLLLLLFYKSLIVDEAHWIQRHAFLMHLSFFFTPLNVGWVAIYVPRSFFSHIVFVLLVRTVKVSNWQSCREKKNKWVFQEGTKIATIFFFCDKKHVWCKNNIISVELLDTCVVASSCRYLKIPWNN